MSQDTNRNTAKPAVGRRQSAMEAIGLAALGVVITTALIVFLPSPQSGDAAAQPGFLVFLTLLVVEMVLVTAVHELAHLLAGLLVGFRFALVMVGPLMITREQRRLRVRMNKEIGFVGGLAAFYPADDHDMRRRLLVAIAAGPGVTLVIAVLATRALSSGLPGASATGYLAVWMLALVSCFLFVLSALPRRAAGMVSDGLRLLMLLRGNQEAEQLSLAMMLQGASMSGQRPRDWNRGVVERMLSLHGDALTDGAASLLAYYHSLDGGDAMRAGALLDRALERTPTLVALLQAPFLLEAAYFEAWRRGNADRAQALLAQVANNPLVEKQSRLRAEAALLFARGDKAGAAAKAGEGLLAIKDSYDLGGAQAEADWLREIMAAARR